MQPAKLKQILFNKAVVALFFLAFIFVITVSHFFLVFKEQRHKEELKNNIQVIPLGKDYVPNELIVQFDEGYVPSVLLTDIKRREKLGKTFFGKVKLSFENGLLWYVSKEKPETKLALIDSELKKIGVISYEPTVSESTYESLSRFYLFTFSSSKKLGEGQDNLSGLFFIASIEPNIILRLFAEPDDPYYSQLWGIQKISMPQAWDISTGSESIVVGVIDSGIDINHPDLLGRTIGGRDFVRNDSIPDDELGHGTHVAGTIGAIGNNGVGVVGVNWNVKMMPLKICIATGQPAPRNSSCSLSYVAEAIRTGLQNGAKVFNMSLGGESVCTPQLQSIIDTATVQGAVIVTAAGNSNSDANGFTPANCQNVITVGASDTSDARSIWNLSTNQASNYGSVVEIAAPGSGIVSTVPGGYDQKNGTSMAAPHVAGAVALLFAVNPSLSPQQVFECITQNADSISTDRLIGGKRLNVSKVISACKDLNPQGSPPTITVSPSPVDITLTPTVSPVPSATVSPTTTITPTVSLVVTPIITQPPIVIPSPSPGERYFTCRYDPSCNKNTNVIQLCPLICTPL